MASYTVELVAFVCPECGLLYGHIKEFKYGRCPSCANKEIEDLKKSVDFWIKEGDDDDYTIRALRGVITKLNNKIKRLSK
jgi:DNA-directed RNA polymerase subunit RPC12/RpoP